MRVKTLRERWGAETGAADRLPDWAPADSRVRVRAFRPEERYHIAVLDVPFPVHKGRPVLECDADWLAPCDASEEGYL